MPRPDVTALTLAGVAAAGTVTTAVMLPGEIEPILVPALFALVGAMGPLWGGSRYVCRALIGLGAAHLASDALVAISTRVGPVPVWHAAALLLYVAGFAILVPLAAGYPSGPAPRWSVLVASIGCLVPIAAVLSGPTPGTLSGPGLPGTVAPIATFLPSIVARLAAVVFVLPLLAASVAVVRAIRGGRELRGRLALPLAALAVLAAFVVLGVLLPHGPLSTALFLVTSPLVPVALIAGSRPVPPAPDPLRSAAVEATDGLPRLTPREREVLALMAEGQSNPAIGRTLHISLSAVEKHATSIFVKLGLLPEADTHRRVAAVVAYLRAARS